MCVEKCGQDIMSKVVKLLIGLLMLPLCVGIASAVWRVLMATDHEHAVWIPMLVGVVLWLLIYLVFPRPMWLYVAGHELTHALCALGFGKKVGKLKVTSQGGNVEVSDSNFIIALAPYFVPFYAILVVLGFWVAGFFLSWNHLELPFLGLLGAAYAFHLTFTAHVLKTRQSDITDHGCVFSAVVIFIGNALVLLAGIPLLTSTPKISTALQWCWQDTYRLFQSVQQWIG